MVDNNKKEYQAYHSGINKIKKIMENITTKMGNISSDKFKSPSQEISTS